MTLDLNRFVAGSRPLWDELDRMLTRLERSPDAELSLPEAERLHYLYQRASADLLRVRHLSSERELQSYLEQLVGRAFSEVHAAAERVPLRPWRWFSRTFPQTVRRHARAMLLAVALTMLGSAFGALAGEARGPRKAGNGGERTKAGRRARAICGRAHDAQHAG